MHENISNGKKYIGITSKANPNHRWSNGNGYKENPHFYSAIMKYGWDGFKHEILFSDLSEKDAKKKEQELISQYKTQDNTYGYNMTSGGDGTPNYHPSLATRAKLSECRRKENLSEETLRRRSDGLKGRKFSAEHKQKIGQANSKPIEMLSIEGDVLRLFSSAHEAEIELNIHHSHISQCCNKQRSTTGGYRWRFAQ